MDVQPPQPPVQRPASTKRVLGWFIVLGILAGGGAFWRYWSSAEQKVKRAEKYYLRGKWYKALELRSEAAWAGNREAMRVLLRQSHNTQGAGITFARFFGRHLSEQGDPYGSSELEMEYGTWSWNYWMTSPSNSKIKQSGTV